MPSRLIIALAFSLVLHGILLLPDVFNAVAPPRPVLQASLRLPPLPPPPVPTEAPKEFEPLLKNTLDEDAPEEVKPVAPPPLPPPKPKTKNKVSISQREMQDAQKKLSRYVYYPEQARKLGLEGTVMLHVELLSDGRVDDVRIVSSSGHAILDNAAIKGFYAAGRLPGKSDTWAYTFRLQ